MRPVICLFHALITQIWRRFTSQPVDIGATCSVYIMIYSSGFTFFNSSTERMKRKLILQYFRGWVDTISRISTTSTSFFMHTELSNLETQRIKDASFQRRLLWLLWLKLQPPLEDVDRAGWSPPTCSICLAHHVRSGPDRVTLGRQGSWSEANPWNLLWVSKYIGCARFSLQDLLLLLDLPRLCSNWPAASYNLRSRCCTDP